MFYLIGSYFESIYVYNMDVWVKNMDEQFNSYKFISYK